MAPACNLTMYTSSEHEHRWLDRPHHHQICKAALEAEEIRLSRIWLNYTEHASAIRGPTRPPFGEEERVFSHFESCGEREYIEPLTGYARHPFANSGCKPRPPELPLVGLDSTAHILLANRCNASTRVPAGPVHGRHARSHSRQRSFLFDMGCGGPPVAGRKTQKLSIPTLVAWFASECIEFDHIFAWELQPQPPQGWWAAVPPSLRRRISFFNVAVAREPWAPLPDDNRSDVSFIETLRATALPDDFVAVKLDVDHSPTELSIVNAILDDPSTAALIDEFFFEFHFAFDAHTTLYYYWRGDGGAMRHTVDEALHTMHRLRERGVRAHFWI